MKVLKQKTLRESKEIFNELTNILSEAKIKIQVVSAWFTDSQLLDILIKKQKEGIQVSVIISDQKDNNKLPFIDLISAGGDVLKVKKTGYGMMHQKFCIVDGLILVHGSYNWTINARKNNDESVIITNHDQTVVEMGEIFNQLMGNSTAVNGKKKNIIKRIIDGISNKSIANKESKKQAEEQDLNENGAYSNLDKGYQAILDNLIESEISNFDKDELEDFGFQQSKCSDGNHEMLKSHLDAVYSSFLNDISLSEDKLKELKARVERVRVNAISQKEQYQTIQKNSIEKVHENKLNERLQELNRINKEIESKLANVTSIEEQKKTLSQKIQDLKEKLDGLSLTFKPLKIKKYELYGFSVLAFISLVSIFLFYGSALYILLFSTEDAQSLIQSGVIPESPGIFDGDAFTKALSKGYMTLLLICSFFVVPVILSLIMIYNKSSKYKLGYYFGLLGVLIVDTLLAYIVAKNVHDVQYLIGNVTEVWSSQNIIYDVSFWSVFLVGSLVVVLFEFCIGKVKAYFDAQEGDIDNRKLNIEDNQIRERIIDNESDLNDLNLQIIEYHSKINQLKIDAGSIQRDVDALPNEKEREQKNVDLLVTNEINTIDENCDLVIVKLESGRLPYSFDSVKERVSIYLNGWNKFLHSQFAASVAKEKTNEMNHEKNRWLEEKYQLNSVKKVA